MHEKMVQVWGVCISRRKSFALVLHLNGIRIVWFLSRLDILLFLCYLGEWMWWVSHSRWWRAGLLSGWGGKFSRYRTRSLETHRPAFSLLVSRFENLIECGFCAEVDERNLKRENGPNLPDEVPTILRSLSFRTPCCQVIFILARMRGACQECRVGRIRLIRSASPLSAIVIFITFVNRTEEEKNTTTTGF